MASAFTPSISAGDIGISQPQDLYSSNALTGVTSGFMGGGGLDTSAFGGSNNGGMFGDMSSKDKWAAGLGLAGTAFQGAQAFQNMEIQNAYMKKMNEDMARKRKEDADYDAFKNSWSGGGGTNASTVGLAAPTSGVTTGTKTAPPVY